MNDIIEGDEFRIMWLKDGESLANVALNSKQIRFCNILQKYGDLPMREIAKILNVHVPEGNNVAQKLIARKYVSKTRFDPSKSSFKWPLNVWIYSLRVSKTIMIEQ